MTSKPYRFQTLPFAAGAQPRMTNPETKEPRVLWSAKGLAQWSTWLNPEEKILGAPAELPARAFDATAWLQGLVTSRMGRA